MQAKELMSRPAVTVQGSDSLAHAAQLMQQHGCGCVVVVGEHNRATAVLTDRDICMAALRTNRALSQLLVRAAMSPKLHACRPDDDLAKVEQVMDQHRVRRLPVVDASGRVLGLLALDDLAREARRERGLFAPHVGSAEVGHTLGQITRPHLLGGQGEQATTGSASVRG